VRALGLDLRRLKLLERLPDTITEIVGKTIEKNVTDWLKKSPKPYD
jgi:hypothetical protein